MQIDHVLIAVPDLGPSVRAVEEQLGMLSLEGGRHPAWGTANRIVPLGEAYLELVAVEDEAAAETVPFGRWVARSMTDRPKPMGWAVRVEHLDETANRLGLTVGSGSRARPDGRTISWRAAGIETAASEPSLPFFIEWANDADLPGRTPVAHGLDGMRIARLVIDGDPDRLATWLGEHELPVEIRRGPAAVAHVVLEHGGREIVL